VQTLEKVAAAVSVAILIAAAIYWIIQIRDVLTLLESA
jgi:hypothetical protein